MIFVGVMLFGHELLSDDIIYCLLIKVLFCDFFRVNSQPSLSQPRQPSYNHYTIDVDLDYKGKCQKRLRAKEDKWIKDKVSSKEFLKLQDNLVSSLLVLLEQQKVVREREEAQDTELEDELEERRCRLKRKKEDLDKIDSDLAEFEKATAARRLATDNVQGSSLVDAAEVISKSNLNTHNAKDKVSTPLPLIDHFSKLPTSEKNGAGGQEAKTTDEEATQPSTTAGDVTASGSSEVPAKAGPATDVTKEGDSADEESAIAREDSTTSTTTQVDAISNEAHSQPFDGTRRSSRVSTGPPSH